MGTKRVRDDASGTPKAKKSKVDKSADKKHAPKENATAPAAALVSEEVDFPRGGGTSFTALEVKAIRAEAAKEADQELFEVRNTLQSYSVIFNSCDRRRKVLVRPSRSMARRERLASKNKQRQFAWSISTTR